MNMDAGDWTAVLLGWGTGSAAYFIWGADWIVPTLAIATTVLFWSLVRIAKHGAG